MHYREFHITFLAEGTLRFAVDDDGKSTDYLDWWSDGGRMVYEAVKGDIKIVSDSFEGIKHKIDVSSGYAQ